MRLFQQSCQHHLVDQRQALARTHPEILRQRIQADGCAFGRLADDAHEHAAGRDLQLHRVDAEVKMPGHQLEHGHDSPGERPDD